MLSYAPQRADASEFRYGTLCLSCPVFFVAISQSHQLDNATSVEHVGSETEFGIIDATTLQDCGKPYLEFLYVNNPFCRPLSPSPSKWTWLGSIGICALTTICYSVSLDNPIPESCASLAVPLCNCKIFGEGLLFQD
ncbi:hypothetical protein F4811DRAFT_556985 [Daldinia bambusicola]|nr:hypothetical protein F4811DRAFT_556985 [Daldinia bambusicola]